MRESKVILGVDPGTSVLGYGLICVEGDKLSMLTFGVVHLSKLENITQKLTRIYTRIDGLIKEYSPTELAIEAPFFGKNVQSMLKLGRAQGVAIAACLSNGMSFEEYSPKRVKQAVTGNGNASKEQVASMLKKMFLIQEMPTYLDATDGLAVAVCHHFSKGIGLQSTTKGTSWGSFIKDHEKRLKPRG